MVYSWKSTRKFLGLYACFYLILAGVLFFGLKWYKQTHYSQQKLDYMMDTVSVYRDKTDDPCKYSIFGDPYTAQDNFVKVFFYCSASVRATNTADLRAIDDKSIGGVIKEIGRINGFEVLIANNTVKIGKTGNNDQEWQCLLDQKIIRNFSEQVKRKATIECFND